MGSINKDRNSEEGKMYLTSCRRISISKFVYEYKMSRKLLHRKVFFILTPTLELGSLIFRQPSVQDWMSYVIAYKSVTCKLKYTIPNF